MIQKLQRTVFRVVRALVKLFYPKTDMLGTEHLPKEPCIIVANHSQMHGPIVGELYVPGKRKIWCAGEMMQLREVPPYAFRDFWSRKPKRSQWFFKLASYIIAPLSVCVFNHAQTIGVYHDKRIISTFRDTITALTDGCNVIIFPEHDAQHNHILCDFQQGFVDVAKSYYKKTKQPIAFVPAYLAPKLHQMHFGTPVYFDPAAVLPEERARICEALMAQITEIATALPHHQVIPYNNVSKKEYGYNKPEEAVK